MNSPRFFPALCGLFLLGSVVAARAGSVADLDRQNGLPDAQIGTPVTAFKGLQQTEDTGRWSTYKRPSDRLTFGQFELTGITYNFFKGKLYSIFLEVEGKRNVKGLIRALEALYGREHSLEKRPLPPTPIVMETREWTGQKLYLLYKNSDNFSGGQITYLDRPVWDSLQVPKQERAAELRKLLQGSFTNGDF